MRVLIAPDKFKGTLSATEAADAIARGWRKSRPADSFDLFPVSDGGDGFGRLLSEHLGAQERRTRTVNAANEPVVAPWWWVPRRRWAIVESAQVVGLALLPQGRFHPFELDTRGLGRVLIAAARLRPALCLVGIGGSATNDAAFGLARTLGWKFVARGGRIIESWTDLWALDRVIRPSEPVRFRQLTVAVDVRNPLLGPRGATRVYGPQKGVRPEDIKPVERCLRRLASVIATQYPEHRRRGTAEGAGAAGGLGFGLSVFAGARIEPGFDLFARLTGFASRVRRADLVITGEGAIDQTTLKMGKGVGQVARLARRFGIPCLALAGTLTVNDNTTSPFTRLLAIAPHLTSQGDAMSHAAFWLTQLAAQTASANPLAPA